MVEAGRGRRLEHHAVHLRRDRPDIGNLAEGRRRMARIEKALQELEPRRPAGDLRRHKPELATRMRMIHLRLSVSPWLHAQLPSHGSPVPGVDVDARAPADRAPRRALAPGDGRASRAAPLGANRHISEKKRQRSGVAHTSGREAVSHHGHHRGSVGSKERTSMTLTSNLAYDTPAARRLRRIAPLVVLLGLMALIMAPGLIARLSHDDGARRPDVVALTPAAPEG